MGNWEFLARIPSIVYGFFALYTIIKFVENIFELSAGESVLSGSLILSIMILPFFTSHLIKSMNCLKDKFLKDSYALGVSKGYFILNIVLKSAFLAGIVGLILAFSRGLLEKLWLWWWL